jgi:hypothetical protein
VSDSEGVLEQAVHDRDGLADLVQGLEVMEPGVEEREHIGGEEWAGLGPCVLEVLEDGDGFRERVATLDEHRLLPRSSELLLTVAAAAAAATSMAPGVVSMAATPEVLRVLAGGGGCHRGHDLHGTRGYFHGGRLTH